MNKKLFALLALVLAVSARHLQYHYAEEPYYSGNYPSHAYSDNENLGHYADELEYQH